MKRGQVLIGLMTFLSVMQGLTACTTAPSSNTYSTVQAGTLQEVQYATVVSVRPVVIQQNASETGQAAGGVIGAVAGSEVGKGKGQIVGGVAGAVAGASIGGLIDRAASQQQGVEITLKLKDDRTVAIAQVADEEFRPDDTVRIITLNGKARVAH
ncbi:MAG: glycine zipper 2TM domain-containing protein [Thiothrix sp.]|nr:glycine zipper 2TM domain-containing protein [Thiothrix sp.]HPE61734.1 glycine zipper 2TM domain-containing protein [Thiolinea sp.]